MIRLFWLVASLTAVSFGGGQTLLAGLEHELVQTGEVTARQFAGAVALGQSTPGPLAAFTTALGYQVDGVSGAFGATAGLCVVSLVAVALIGRIPPAWFALRPVRTALKGTAPLASALALYMAWRVTGSEPVGPGGLLIIAGVALGRVLGAPVPVLAAAAVVVGIIVG